VRLLEVAGPGPVEALREAMTAAWPDNEQRRLRWPLTIKLARR